MEALFGAIVGGVFTIVGGMAVKFFEESRARRSLRAAFRAEIVSIVEMIDARGHRKLFEDLLDHWKRTDTGESVLIGPLAKLIDPVFSKSSDKIGLLGRDVAGNIVQFYAIVDGLREDTNILGGTMDPRLSRSARIQMIEADLQLLSETRELARRLLALL